MANKMADLRTLSNPKDIADWRAEIEEEKSKIEKSVRVCIGTGCSAKGSNRLYELFCEAAEEYEKQSGRKILIEAKCVGCHGLCEQGPIVVVQPDDVLYRGVEEPDVEEIFRETIVSERIVDRLLYEDPATEKKAKNEEDIPFYKAQKRIVLAENGRIDPRRIEEYILADGYTALTKALGSVGGDAIIDEVEKAGLRGRGGGGFSTARKWRSCREAKGDQKYVICNGDEGDPGAFMDRSIMEGNPHSVIEGLIIGGYAIGASHGYIYVRNEYPLAVEHLTLAIDQAHSCGFLGQNILGSGFSFDIRINRGGGAFVCGESTALMASLEGKEGTPRTKYIHTVESGLRDKPTVLNNVETWANIPHIVNNGGDWLAKIGTDGSKGTKVFSLVGQVVNTGLVEVPMGITLREIIEDIGGGTKNGKAFKAVQTGGPSGGCIPAEHLDVKVDFDELTKLGSMMGSGGMIVMDEDSCMVNVAKYFLSFLKEESCGKCTPCREGIAQMLDILERITEGNGRTEDLDALEELADLTAETSLCALGQTAANPVISTLRYFREEYKTHIQDGKCPAKECKGMFAYEISADPCTGCGICKKNCPVDAISGERRQPHDIDSDICTKCGICFEKCPFTAIMKV
jgi:NADH:ubiquinone oxidoreductase subunit F (NADH-binding)/(2Fe-2S) ferredoxin/Pyruvate/2-oxoacid:ferredoxin oxidoreductase delta subunit